MEVHYVPNKWDIKLTKKHHERFLKIDCRYDCIICCVIVNGPTKHYKDYDDTLEEYNQRQIGIGYAKKQIE